jgi:lanosterol synthase
MFLIPGLLIAMYVTETPIPEEYKVEIPRYLRAMFKDSGGWGM